MEELIERSLVVFKPDAVQRGIVGEILSRFERVGLKMVGMKMSQPDAEMYHEHYEGISKFISRRGQEAYDVYMKFLASGPVVAVVFEGVEAVAVVRKIVGATEPKAADMGTIRGDYAHVSYGYTTSRKIGVPNLIHASGDVEEAEKEIALWFKPNELMDYEMLHEKFTR